MSFGIPVRNGLGIGLRASTALSTRGGAGGGLDVATVFSTSLYTGTGAAQTITNGINLSGSGGLVWVKNRNSTRVHCLFDTQRGSDKLLQSQSTAAQITNATAITSFSTSGFSLGTENEVNASTATFASWTFREAPNFFDVVTYTGNGVNGRAISHSLGVAPGCIIVKAISTAGLSWFVYNRSAGVNGSYPNYLYLNSTSAAQPGEVFGWNAVPTATEFFIGSFGEVNNNGTTYVAYLYAHDAASTGIIQCGSYTGNGLLVGPVINLGWEPQWLMIKNASGVGNWQIIDSVRGMPVGAADATLQANLANAETLVDYVSPTATGFQVVSISSQVNTLLSTYIYIAIRKAP